MRKNPYRDAMSAVDVSENFERNLIARMKKTALKKRERNRLRRFLYAGAGVAVCAALVAIGLHILGAKTPSSVQPGKGQQEAAVETPSLGVAYTALLSVNPSVEFQVDEKGRILQVIGTNEDGAALILGVDFTGLSFENAVIVVVNRLIEENYITASLVEDNILLSVSGGANRADMLEVMSSVIESAASQYDLSVEAKKMEGDELELVLAGRIEAPTEGELPAVPENGLPVSLKVEYALTGRAAPYSEVEDVWLTLENGETYPSYKILTSYDLAGGDMNFVTLWCMHALIEKGYISNDLQGQILIRLQGSTAEQMQETKELISLILEDGMFLLKAEIAGEDTLRILPSMSLASQTASRYTFAQLLDMMYIKNTEDISARQRQILEMVFPENGGADFLVPRYWAVVPDFLGMTEEEAVALCERTGFIPVVVRESSIEGEVGKVIFQDSNAGGIWEVGSRFQLNIRVNP